MSRLRILSVFIGMIALIAACGGDAQGAPTTPTATLEGAKVPTRIPTSTPTATSTPTSTPTLTPTNTLTSTPTSTSTATPTVDAAQIDLYIDDGNSFIDLRRYDRAIVEFNNAIELNPEAVDAYLGRGLAHYYLEQYEDAIASYNIVLELDPDDPDAYFNRGLAHSERGNHEAAVADFGQVIELDPLDSEAYYYRGISQYDVGNIDEALADFEEAIIIIPDYAEAFAARGLLYYTEGDYVAALPDLQEYAAIAGNTATEDLLEILAETRELALPLLISEADQLLSNGQPQEALNVYTFALENDPENIDALFGRAYSFIGLNSPEDAIANFSRILELQPENTLALFERGMQSAAIGDNETALADLQQHIALAGDEAVPDAQAVVDQLLEASRPQLPEFIEIGQAVESEITADFFEARTQFEGREGQIINIDMIALDGDLDPILRLLDESGNMIAENDDAEPGNRNSAIRGFRLPTDGIYTIVATRFQQDLGSTTGHFVLNLNPGQQQPPTPEPTSSPIPLPDSRMIDFGQSVEETITPENFEFRVSFEARMGQIINIEMIALDGDLDPILRLLDESGNMIAENDDAEPGNRNSAIRGFHLPTDGIYTIVATRFQQDLGSTQGRFILTLNPGQRQPPTPEMIEFNQTIENAITPENFEIRVSFQARAGDVITIEMIALEDSLDPFLILLNPNDEPIAENDDAEPGNRNAGIREIPIEQDGRYTIVATRFQQELGTTIGRFTLTLAGGEPGSRPPQPPGGGPRIIAYGDPRSGQIRNNRAELPFRFEGNAGDIINIRMIAVSGDLDPFLILLDPNGNEIIRNDDAEPGSSDAGILDFQLSVRGEYTIIATRFQRELGSTTGQFDLILEQSGTSAGSQDLLSYGDSVDGEINNEQPEIRFQFAGMAGDVIDLDLMAVSGDLDPLLLLLDSNGNEIIRNDDGDPGTRNSYFRNFELPADGIYIIVATRFQQDLGRTFGAFRLNLNLSAGSNA